MSHSVVSRASASIFVIFFRPVEIAFFLESRWCLGRGVMWFICEPFGLLVPCARNDDIASCCGGTERRTPQADGQRASTYQQYESRMAMRFTVNSVEPARRFSLSDQSHEELFSFISPHSFFALRASTQSTHAQLKATEMVKQTLFLSSLAALALASTAQAQTFTGDGTAYTLGSVSQGNCNFMASTPSAATNYAAINDPQWDSLKNCGRCAQVSCIDAQCADKTISEIVHIVDRCPECKQGDLDLSPSVFKKITGSSPSRLKIQWKFVDCPNPGNLQYCLKAGSNPYFVAIQPANAAAGVASMKINGKATTMVDSAFYYVLNSQSPVDLSAVKVSLTSTGGATVEETVSLSVGSCTAGKSNFGGSSAVTPPATTPKATSAPAPAATPKATPAATPKPSTTPKATSKPTSTPKPSKTPKTPKPTKNSSVGSEATTAPAPSSASEPSTPASSAGGDDEYATPAPASSTGGGDEYATPAPASSTGGDDEYATPAPASSAGGDDEYATPAPASSTGGDEYATPAPASSAGSDGESTTPASSTGGDDEYATPAPAATGEDDTDAAVTPSVTPAVTPKKSSKPSNCVTKSSKQAGKEAKKKAKQEKKAKKEAEKAKQKKQNGGAKKTSNATTTTTAPAPAY